MNTQQKTVLIIEDEQDMLIALREQLGGEGFSVLQARDGAEGLRLALEQHPDIILLDLALPKVDGMMLLKELRDDAWGKKAKVIVLTNLSEVEKISDALQSEVYEYLIKSDWKMEDIIKKIHTKLSVE
ncbi:hypothetical protein COB18_00860 [Candidatus Kaiserbacteria bacterium]|nr:MAG: hypothetical protein COB18_00860 [Candidatus Kaiserbacteria bacterium]